MGASALHRIVDDRTVDRRSPRFAMAATWLCDDKHGRGVLLVRVVEGDRVNHLRIGVGQARAVRIELAYAVAEADGATELVVDGVPFALDEAEAFYWMLANALASLDVARDERSVVG